jgi:hypothetical protein
LLPPSLPYPYTATDSAREPPALPGQRPFAVRILSMLPARGTYARPRWGPSGETETETEIESPADYCTVQTESPTGTHAETHPPLPSLFLRRWWLVACDYRTR